jgi:biopolymer transport protein ExbD
MRFRPGPSRRRRAAVTIDITSLVDVVFLLLIFLLITTTFRRNEHAFRITLPTSSAQEVTVTTEKTTVFIDAEGDLHLLVVPADASAEVAPDPRAVTVEALKGALAEIHARRPDAPVAIRGEQTTRYQRMIDVVAIVEGAGFRNIWFPYELESPP